jgi:hypothetical protein
MLANGSSRSFLRAHDHELGDGSASKTGSLLNTSLLFSRNPSFKPLGFLQCRCHNSPQS